MFLSGPAGQAAPGVVADDCWKHAGYRCEVSTRQGRVSEEDRWPPQVLSSPTANSPIG